MFKRRAGNCQGNALVEFALLLPLLLSIVGGVTDFGLIFYASHTAQNAARDGARYAVTLDLDTPAATSNVINRVQERIPATGLFARFTDITVTPGGDDGCDVSVRVAGEVPFFFLQIVPLIGPVDIFSEPRPIVREVTMRYEHESCRT